jgi:hypothetical protein
MDMVLHAAIGIGLSAAAGFRILVPFLFAGIAAREGYLTLSPGMAWMANDTAILAMTVATALEVLVYFIPVVDNLMDAVEVPAAAIAGIILTASVTGDMDPFLRWSLALIAGGTISSSTAAFTSLSRLASTAAAGPFGNIAVSTVELASSTVLSILAILMPVVVVIVVAILLYLAFRRRRRQQRWSPNQREV